MAPHGNNVAPGSAEHSWELGFRGGSSIRAPGVTGTTVVQLTNLTIILTATRIDQTASELEETTPSVVQRQLLGRSGRRPSDQNHRSCWSITHSSPPHELCRLSTSLPDRVARLSTSWLGGVLQLRQCRASKKAVHFSRLDSRLERERELEVRGRLALPLWGERERRDHEECI